MIYWNMDAATTETGMRHSWSHSPPTLRPPVWRLVLTPNRSGGRPHPTDTLPMGWAPVVNTFATSIAPHIRVNGRTNLPY